MELAFALAAVTHRLEGRFFRLEVGKSSTPLRHPKVVEAIAESVLTPWFQYDIWVGDDGERMSDYWNEWVRVHWATTETDEVVW